MTVAVEGSVDEAVARWVAHALDLGVVRVFGKEGKAKLLKSLHGYNRAAAQSPWWVLLDLDNDALCPGDHVADILPNPSRHMKLRVAVRAIESWLMADQQQFAHFLRIRRAAVPEDPDDVEDPKGLVIQLAQGSTSSRVRESLVPRSGSGRRVGPGYAASLIEFAEQIWDPGRAAENSESLRRCCERLPLQT
jgi:hypothetical protein